MRYGHSKQGNNQVNLAIRATQMQAFSTQNTKIMKILLNNEKNSIFLAFSDCRRNVEKSGARGESSLFSHHRPGIQEQKSGAGGRCIDLTFCRPKRKKSPETLHLRPRPNSVNGRIITTHSNKSII